MDQFFTVTVIAELCLQRLDLHKYPTIIEPSCGDGSFFKLLPSHAIGIEIDPKVACVGARIMDFFDYQPDNLPTPILIVGNPPFGRISSLAIRFFNHAASFADTIAFIVPATFRRFSVTNRLNLHFHCHHDEVIPKGSFRPKTMQARCVFQIWERQLTQRIRVIIPTSEDFWPVPRKEADIALKAYGGSGDCGTIIPPEDVVNPRAYHFLRIRNRTVIERLQRLPYYPLASYTVRQDSIGLSDLYWLYSQSEP